MTLFWLGASIAGLHPDGAILGFAGTMYAIWATAEHNERIKREVANREEEVEVNRATHRRKEGTSGTSKQTRKKM